MTVKMMKQILADKLQDEGCYFTKKDVNIKAYKNGFQIFITDYENITYYLHTEYDDYFGFVVYVYDEWAEKLIVMEDNRTDYDYRTALIRLGYRIGTTY